jgi:hypothetical protein
MYFMFNPIFKHQNTMDPFVLFFVLGILLTLWAQSVVMEIRLVFLTGGILGFLAVTGFFTLRFMGLRVLILFNVTRKDGWTLEAFIKDNAVVLGLSEADIWFRPDWPWLVLFHTRQHALSAKLAKETETFIRNHVSRKFMPAWASIVIGLILIAILWRF